MVHWMINTKNKLLLPVAASLLAMGCSRAPSVDIIGSLFPVWMVCLTIAIILAACLRGLLLHFRLESEVGPLALFYPSAVVLFTCLLWLILFR
jgi:YtcA family